MSLSDKRSTTQAMPPTELPPGMALPRHRILRPPCASPSPFGDAAPAGDGGRIEGEGCRSPGVRGARRGHAARPGGMRRTEIRDDRRGDGGGGGGIPRGMAATAMAFTTPAAVERYFVGNRTTVSSEIMTLVTHPERSGGDCEGPRGAGRAAALTPAGAHVGYRTRGGGGGAPHQCPGRPRAPAREPPLWPGPCHSQRPSGVEQAPPNPRTPGARGPWQTPGQRGTRPGSPSPAGPSRPLGPRSVARPLCSAGAGAQSPTPKHSAMQRGRGGGGPAPAPAKEPPAAGHAVALIVHVPCCPTGHGL